MNCPNCQWDNISLFHNKVWSSNDGKVYHCQHCDLIFIHPMMNDEEEKQFYKNFNKHVLARGAISEQSLVTYHDYCLPIAKERFTTVSKYFVKGMDILEIGSSTGAFLSLLTECNTSAVEPADDNREFSKQFANRAVYSSLDEVPGKQQYDLICMFHVFEHIKRPKEFLMQCKKLLKEDGVLIIEVPHSQDPLISVYNLEAFKDFVFQPMHPMVYSAPSLRYIFGEAGFTEKEIIYYQRYGLDNHLSWLRWNKPGGDPSFAKLFAGNKEYKQTLIERKLTNTLFYVAAQKE